MPHIQGLLFIFQCPGTVVTLFLNLSWLSTEELCLSKMSGGSLLTCLSPGGSRTSVVTTFALLAQSTPCGSHRQVSVTAHWNDSPEPTPVFLEAFLVTFGMSAVARTNPAALLCEAEGEAAVSRSHHLYPASLSRTHDAPQPAWFPDLFLRALHLLLDPLLGPFTQITWDSPGSPCAGGGKECA